MSTNENPANRTPHAHSPAHDHGEGEGQNQSHDHSHEHNHSSELGEMDVRVRTLESLLVEKGYLDPKSLDLLIETYETQVGPHNGARVVARAWVDPDYKAWLLSDATAAIADLGFSGRGAEHMIVLENTSTTHNVVVCTLCSCYPWAVLGLPPVWYKSAPYRSRVVIDPRGVLAEFGCELDQDVQVKVWDSNAELRYLVLPMRPAGTEGWDESSLANLVTRDAMIGTNIVHPPTEQTIESERASL